MGVFWGGVEDGEEEGRDLGAQSLWDNDKDLEPLWPVGVIQQDWTQIPARFPKSTQHPPTQILCEKKRTWEKGQQANSCRIPKEALSGKNNPSSSLWAQLHENKHLEVTITDMTAVWAVHFVETRKP